MTKHVFQERESPMRPIVVSTGVTHSYLLPCRGGYLQIDTGYSHHYTDYRKRLALVGIDVEQVRHVLLTHHHDDHSGFLNDLVDAANPTLIVHERGPELLRGGNNDRSRGGGYVNRWVAALASAKMRLDPRWTLTFPPFSVRSTDVVVRGDDDRLLRELGVAGKIVYTPGHCMDHLCVVLDGGEAFCGDAASSFLLWAGTRYCAVFMTDMDETYRSWRRLLHAGAKRMFPAHGRPFAAAHLRRNLGRIATRDLIRFF